MTTAYYSTVLDYSLPTVWALIRDFNNYPAYIDGVSESVIEDDKGAYSAGLSYQTFPVVNKAFYDGLTEEQRTSFTDTLDAVNAALKQEAIIPLISRVEFDQEDPEVVAQEFLSEAGIVEN